MRGSWACPPRAPDPSAVARDRATGFTVPERIVWLVYSRGEQYRRTKQGRDVPPLRPDEHAYRVVLPTGTPGDRYIVSLHAERVA